MRIDTMQTKLMSKTILTIRIIRQFKTLFAFRDTVLDVRYKII